VGFVSPVAEFTPKSVETEELRTKLVFEVRVFVQDPNDELRLGMPVTVDVDSAGGTDHAPEDGATQKSDR
jgi:HlyD family secretion protein